MENDLKTSDFYYDLPKELIAQDPLEDRSSSRLLVMDRETGELTHTVFSHVIDYLEAGDCLVINDTKVIPARLIGERLPREVAGGVNSKNDPDASQQQPRAHMELLLLKRLGDRTWETLAKPGKRAKEGDRISFGDGALTATIIEVKEDGNRIVRFDFEGIFEEIRPTRTNAASAVYHPQVAGQEPLSDRVCQVRGVGCGTYGGASFYEGTACGDRAKGREDRACDAPCGIRYVPAGERGEYPRSQDAYGDVSDPAKGCGPHQ